MEDYFGALQFLGLGNNKKVFVLQIVFLFPTCSFEVISLDNSIHLVVWTMISGILNI